LSLNVFQSVEDKYPLAEVVAALIEIVFVVLTKGLENVNTFSLPLKVDQSAELNAPLFKALAVGTFKVITGVVVPLQHLNLNQFHLYLLLKQLPM
jgi:hypothetical protein